MDNTPLLPSEQRRQDKTGYLASFFRHLDGQRYLFSFKKNIIKTLSEYLNNEIDINFNIKLKDIKLSLCNKTLFECIISDNEYALDKYSLVPYIKRIALSGNICPI